MPRPRLLSALGSMPLAVSMSRAHLTTGSACWAGSSMSLFPPLTIHHPSDAEPSPPTFALLNWVVPAQVLGCHMYLTLSCIPFCAASTTDWAQNVAATMPMKMSGFFDASVVIGSVTVGACASTVSLTKLMLSLLTD